MTKLEFFYEGVRFRIEFEYAIINKGRGVRCYIDKYDQGKWERVCNGWSSCKPPDAFVKDTGRKMAMRRAIGQSGWLKLEKTLPGEHPTATHKWISTFPGDWTRKAWNAAAWGCYLARKL